MEIKTSVQIHDEISENKYHGIFVEEKDNHKWVCVDDVKVYTKQILFKVLELEKLTTQQKTDIQKGFNTLLSKELNTWN